MRLKLYKFALLLMPVSALAQPTVNSVEDYQVGTSVKYVNCMPSIAPGNAGANQHWMFQSSLFPIDTVVDDVINPAFTPYGSLHPTANLVRRTKDGDYIYYNKTAGASYLVAEHDLPSNRHLIHNNPVLSSKRPLAFGNTATDTFTTNETTTGSHGWGTVNMSVDAWGMLHLPGNKNYMDVIRVKMVLSSRDTLSSAPAPLPSPTVLTTVSTIYAWFNNDHKSALLRWDSTAVYINTVTTPQTGKNVAYYMDEYPNDVKTIQPERVATTATISEQKLVLNGDFSKGRSYKAAIFNLNGQKIQEYTFPTGSKSQRLALNTDLTPGMYMILVYSDISATPEIVKAIKQ